MLKLISFSSNNSMSAMLEEGCKLLRLHIVCPNCLISSFGTMTGQLFIQWLLSFGSLKHVLSPSSAPNYPHHRVLGHPLLSFFATATINFLFIFSSLISASLLHLIPSTAITNIFIALYFLQTASSCFYFHLHLTTICHLFSYIFTKACILEVNN